MAYSFDDLFPGQQQPPFSLGGMQMVQPTFKLTGTPDPSKLGASSPGGGKTGNPGMGTGLGAANMVAGSGVLGRPASGALSGAAGGAGLGTFGGPIGMGVGAGLGGLMGLLGGKQGGPKAPIQTPQMPSDYSQKWFGG